MKACESLTESGKIKEKTYGKQKVYVADQSQFPEVWYKRLDVSRVDHSVILT